MNKLLSFLFFLLVNQVVAQEMPTYLQNGQIGGSLADAITHLATDSLGNVYLAGIITGQADLNPNTNAVYPYTSSNARHLFLTKLDATGQFQWTKVFAGNGNANSFQGLEVTRLGDIILAGRFQDSLEVNNGQTLFSMATTPGNFGTFLISLDATGNVNHAYSIPNTIASIGAIDQFTLTPNDHVLLSLLYFGNIDLDFSPNGTNLLQINGNQLLLKLADDFSFINYKELILNSANNSNVNWLRKKLFVGGDQYDYTYVCGEYDQFATIDLDSLFQITGTLNDQFIAKYSQDLDLLSYVHFNQSNPKGLFDFKVDPTGNLYLLGHYQGVMDLDLGPGVSNLPPANTSRRLYLAKYDPNYNLVWSYTLNASVDTLNATLELSDNGQVYLTGTLVDTALVEQYGQLHAFAPINQHSPFILKLDANGDLLYFRMLAADGFGGDLQPAVDGTVHAVGNFQSTANITINSDLHSLTTAGILDGYWLHFEECTGTVTRDTVSVCQGYELGLANQSIETTGNYFLQYPTTTGCDSVVFLQANIQEVDIDILNYNQQLHLISPFDQVQWEYCNLNVALPQDTLADFSPSIAGYYRAIVTYNGCTDTSDCQYIFTVNQEEIDFPRFSLSPNPTAGPVNLHFEQTFQGHLILYNAQGQMIQGLSNIQSQEITFEIAPPSGIYFLHLIEPDGSTQIRKIIKL